MMAEKPFDLKNVITEKPLLGLWRMLTGYHHIYLGAIVSVGLSAVAQTGFFFLLAYFIDNILVMEGQEMLSRLPWVALGFVGFALVQGVFSFLSGRFAAQSAESVTRRLRNYLYDHMQRLTFSYHDNMKAGELIQRSTSDVDALRRFYTEQALGIGRITLLFIVNLVALMFINVRLALVSVVLIPVIVLMSVFFFKKISVAYEAFQEQDGKLSTTLQENLSGVRVVKAFARQQYEQDKFEDDNA